MSSTFATYRASVIASQTNLRILRWDEMQSE
jgi:hypothetical protein